MLFFAVTVSWHVYHCVIAVVCRVLKEGGVLVYDDSFEQELWFTSSRPGLVLSMAVWHPDLSLEQHRRLAPIH